jgi:C4-dicarboxylate-specific signal transduction histidine kinase
MLRAQLPVGLVLTAGLPPTEAQQNRLLDQLQVDNPAVRSVYWVDASGTITAASQRIRDFVGTNIADRSYIRDTSRRTP